MAHAKSIATGRGKGYKWVVRPKQGAHRTGESIPLLVLVRDILGYADTAREARRIIREGKLMVDKKTRKNPNYAVGLMDVVEIRDLKKHFRIIPTKKGMGVKEISDKETSIKPCKIMDKSTLEKGSIQLSLHDGTTVLVDKDNYKTNDTLLLSLPERKITDTITLKKGNLALVVRGRHSGETEKVKEVLEGIVGRKSLTTLGELQTLTDYVFAIGQDKPRVTV